MLPHAEGEAPVDIRSSKGKAEDSGERPAARPQIEAADPSDLELAESLVEEALLAGAEDAEVYFKTSRTTGIVLQGGFTSLSGGTERGVALRVFDRRGRFGHAFASWAGEGTRRELIRTALRALAGTDPVPGEPAAPATRPPRPYPEIEGIVDSRVEAWGPKEKQALLLAALNRLPLDTAARTAALYRDGISRIALATSRGVKAGFRRSLSLLSLTRQSDRAPAVTAEWIGHGPDREAIEGAAAELVTLDPAGSEEAVEPEELYLEPRAAVPLLCWLERHVVEPDPADGEGEIRRLAAEAVNVIDDGLLPGGLATAPFDGEGVPTGRLTLIKAGVQIERLRRRRGAEADRPGHGIRIAYRDLPVPGGSNLFIEPGRRSSESLLDSVGRGYRLSRLEPADSPDRFAGEGWWRGIGWRVRDGRLEGACRRFIFRSAPERLLREVTEVSDRPQFFLRRGVALGTPDLLIRPIR
jgi:PmbA protein